MNCFPCHFVQHQPQASRMMQHVTASDQVKEEIGRPCNTHGREEKCRQGFDEKSKGKILYEDDGVEK
jgi:hypothetical protein